MSRKQSSLKSNTVAIERELGTVGYDTVKIVADNLSDLTTLSDNMDGLLGLVISTELLEQSALDVIQIAAETAASEVNATNSAQSEVNAATSETNAESYKDSALSSKNDAAASASSALSSKNSVDTSESNITTIQTNVVAKESSAETSASNALVSENNAATSETNSASSETNAQSSASASEVSRLASGVSADNAEDQYDLAVLEVAKAEAWSQTAEDNANTTIVPARNSTLNQEAVTQGTSTRTGFSTALYTSTGTTPQDVVTGVDMSSGDFGGLIIQKSRSSTNWWQWIDTVRGTDSRLHSNMNYAESTGTTFLTSFNTDGFSVGTGALFDGGATVAAWSLQTNKKVTGVTNFNEAYTAHYNNELGFSIVGYSGNPVQGHTIDTHLDIDTNERLSIFKNRDTVTDWLVQSPLLSSVDSYMHLSTTAAESNHSTTFTSFAGSKVSMGTTVSMNEANKDMVSYHFATVKGVSKVGVFNGTGIGGNFIDCDFGSKKASFILTKNLDAVSNWVIMDSPRPDKYSLPNTAEVEGTQDIVDFTAGGFTLQGGSTNNTGSRHIFVAFAETDSDATKSWTDHEYATDADTLSVQQDTLIAFAQGMSDTGQVDSVEKVGAGVTYALGTGFEDQKLWLFKDRNGAYGTTVNELLVGLDRLSADTWGKEGSDGLRTTADHTGYASETGIARSFGQLDHSNIGGAWGAFAFNGRWIVQNLNFFYPLWLRYEFTQPRRLVSWRIQAHDLHNRTPKRFTIEGSNDGVSWTVVDSTYQNQDYPKPANHNWGALSTIPVTGTLYRDYQININSNHGDINYTAVSKLELNIAPLESDFYDVTAGVMYNASDVVIERTYLAEIQTNHLGEVATYKNLTAAKQNFIDVDVHGLLNAKDNVKIVDFGVVSTGEKYVVENPFGDENWAGCQAQAYIYESGRWETTGWIYSSSGDGGFGVNSHSTSKGIVVVTGGAYLSGASLRHGGSAAVGGDSAFCIVIVTYNGEATDA